MLDDDLTRQLHNRIDEIDAHVDTVSRVVEVLDRLRERVETRQSQTQDLVGAAAEAVVELRTLGEASRVSAGAIVSIRDLLSITLRAFEDEAAKVGGQVEEWATVAKSVLDELDKVRSVFAGDTSEAAAGIAEQTKKQRELFEEALLQARRPLEEMERQLNRARHDLKDTIDSIQPTVEQAMEEIKPLIVRVAEPAIAGMEGAFRGFEAEGRRINESVSRLLEKVEAEVVGGLKGSLNDLLKTAASLGDAVSNTVEPSVEKFRDTLREASSEVQLSSRDAVSSVAQLKPAYEAAISDVRREVDELRNFLSTSQEFQRIAGALADNIELTEQINGMLAQRKPNLSIRLELAIVALVLGTAIGTGLGGLSMNDAVLVAIPASAVALWSEPIIARLPVSRDSSRRSGVKRGD